MRFGRGANDVSPREAAELVEGGALLLDVREPDEWNAGRAPGALHVPLGSLGLRLEELPRDRRIVAACRSGGRSARAADALRGAGFEVSNLKGGLKAWERAGLPLEPAGGRIS